MGQHDLLVEPVIQDKLANGGIAVGELLALVDQGRTPLVSVKSAGIVPLRARSTVDLHADHVGERVVLVFESGDTEHPIVIGVLAPSPSSMPAPAPGQVEVSPDGERMIVTAQRELVLRCGKASITLHHDGRVQITGESITSRATGPNRVQGGSVQLN